MALTIMLQDIMSCLLDTGSGASSKAEFDAFWSHNVHSAEKLYPGSWHIRADSATLGVRNQAPDVRFTDQGFVLIMPFLHWDTVSTVAGRQKAVELLKSPDLPDDIASAYLEASSGVSTRHSSLSIASDPPLYLPLLLDQYRYPTTSLPSARLDTQLLSRQTKDSATGMKMLVVQQLWLVVTDSS